MERVILIGGGGHCKVVVDAIIAAGVFEPVAILDARHVGESILGVPISHSDQDVQHWRDLGVRLAVVTVGSVGDPSSRIMLARRALDAGFELATVVHPSAVVSPSAEIGAGTYVGPGAVINAEARVGKCCIINTGALVDHDCLLGDFVHLAPGVALSGAVSIGDRSHVGTGSALIQQVKVGADTVVGAGSTVVRDVPAGVVAFGSPCAVRRQRG